MLDTKLNLVQFSVDLFVFLASDDQEILTDITIIIIFLTTKRIDWQLLFRIAYICFINKQIRVFTDPIVMAEMVLIIIQLCQILMPNHPTL